MLAAQAVQGDQRGGFGAVVRNMDPLDVRDGGDGGDGGEDVLPGLDREDIGGRVDRRRIDAEEAEYGGGGDVESDRAVDPVPAGGPVHRRVQADNRLLTAGLRLAGRVDGHVEGDHGSTA